MDYTQYETHGQELVLRLEHPNHFDSGKKGSIFIYDEEVKVWWLKSEYEKLNKDDDFSRVPFHVTSDLKHFGIWRPVD